MKLKLPRFVTEFANYSKKCIDECELMQDQIKKEKIRKIDRTMFLVFYGYITVNEAMQELSKI